MKITKAAIAVLTLAICLVVGSEPPALAVRRAEPAIPALAWGSCHGEFQCATARVPLDYRHPAGGDISLAVIRHEATDPAHRLGSLFVNGGGPSAQIDALVNAYRALPATLRKRYDVIDFDPRGFGASTAIRCFPDLPTEAKFMAPISGILYPVGDAQISLWERTWAGFAEDCAESAGPILYHVTTADVARDMDLLRRAVGAPALNFIGLSYATGLGATYANLFPDRVGHMVLDGNLDPRAWTHEQDGLPTWLRTGQDLATAAVLRDFLNLCGTASITSCAFSAGTPGATRAKFAALLARLRQQPITIGAPPLTYTDVIAANSVPLSQVSRWPDGARVLQQLWEASARPASTTDAAAPAAAQEPYAGLEQSMAMQCADSPNPRALSAYPRAARLAFDRSGLVGPPLAWVMQPCATWPQGSGQDRYAGPWNRATAGTILVIGNTGDPDTPYSSATAMFRQLADARLLTVEGFGHTEFHNPSSCASTYETDYLLTGSLPPPGAVCPQDAVPFP